MFKTNIILTLIFAELKKKLEAAGAKVEVK
jgi:hypothetical protein